jgi:hypothetical protein
MVNRRSQSLEHAWENILSKNTGGNRCLWAVLNERGLILS